MNAIEKQTFSHDDLVRDIIVNPLVWQNNTITNHNAFSNRDLPSQNCSGIDLDAAADHLARVFLDTKWNSFHASPCADSAVPCDDGMENHGVGGDFRTFQDDTVLYSCTGTNAGIRTDGHVGADLGGRMDRRARMDIYRGNDVCIASTRRRRRRRLVRLLQIQCIRGHSGSKFSN